MASLLLPILLSGAVTTAPAEPPRREVRVEAVATVRIVSAEPASETLRKLGEPASTSRSKDRGVQLTRGAAGQTFIEHH